MSEIRKIEIDKEFVVKIKGKIDTDLTDEKITKTLNNLHESLKEIISQIVGEDIVFVEPIKHGKWESRIHGRFYGTDKDGEPIFRDGIVYYCSECRHRSIIKTNFCPDCGVRMGGDT